MRKSNKRLVALLLAVALMMLGLTAVAEAPKPITAEDVYAQGKSIKADFSVQVDGATLTGLMGMMGGAPQDGTQNAQMATINTVISALNKLKATAISTKEAASFLVGTDKGNIVSVQAVMDAQGGGVTSDLFPGVKLALPAELMQTSLQLQSQIPQVNPEDFKAYGDAVANYFTTNIASKAQPEQVTLNVAGLGDFTGKTTVPVTAGDVAGLLTAVNDVLKQDTKTQQLLDEYLKNTAQAQETAAASVSAELNVTDMQGTQVKSAAELIAAIDEAAAEMNKTADEHIANLSLYGGAEKANYFEFEPLENGKPLALVSAGFAGGNFTFGLIANTATETESTAAVDWAALKAGVLDGTNPGAIYVNVTGDTTPDTANNTLVSKVVGDVRAMGMPLGFTANNVSSLAGPYQSNGSFQLNFLAPTPILTFNYNAAETDEAPLALMDTSSIVTLANENMPEADQQALTAALKGALPQLLERLNAALPEEGPILVQILQGMQNPGAVTTNPQ